MEKFKHAMLLSFFSILNVIIVCGLYFTIVLYHIDFAIIWILPIIISIIYVFLSFKLFLKISKKKKDIHPPFFIAFILSILIILVLTIVPTLGKTFIGDEGVILAVIFFISVIVCVFTLILHVLMYRVSYKNNTIQ